MEELFLQVLNMSITASYVVLLILAARLLLKKAPKGYSYALWSVALFRLCCPFSFESMWSLLPVGQKPISPDIVYANVPQIESGIAVIDQIVNASLPAATPDNSINPLQVYVAIGCVVWAAVAVCMVLYSVASALRLASKLKGAQPLGGNIFITQAFPSPFVFGFFHPKIYLPAGLSEGEQNYIVKHEQIHIKRLDHMMKHIAFLVLCVHWFNPLVWIAFFISAKDMELSCDEQVIKELGSGVKQNYSASLLALSTGYHTIGGCPLAFGENDVGGRIKNVLRYKKPAFWVAVASGVAAIAVGVALVANPPSEDIYAFDRISYTSGAGFLRFTVSDKITADMTTYIQVSGRTEQDGMGMSLHLFETETEENSWVAGQTYETTVPAQSLQFLEVYGEVFSKDSQGNRGKSISQMSAQIDKDGFLSIEYKPELRKTWRQGASSGSSQPETASISFDTALALVLEQYPSPFIVEADGDRTMMEEQIGYAFNISMPMTQGDSSEGVPRLVKIVGVIKEDGMLMEYNMATTQWEPLFDSAAPSVSLDGQETAFFVPDMSAQQQTYNAQYVEPLLQSGLLMRDWSAENYASLLPDSADNQGSYLIYAFEDMMGQEKMQPLWDQYQGKFPEQVLEEVLLAQFPFTPAQLHELLASYYKPADKTYDYKGGRGGGPIECAVTEVQVQGDGSVRLEYVFLTSYYDDASTPEKDAYLNKTAGMLILKPTADGKYRYWSVDVGDKIELQAN